MFAVACAGAATNDNAGPLAERPGASAPCLRAQCVDLSALADRSAELSKPRVFVKADRAAVSERGAFVRVNERVQAEDYNCMLSVGFSGEVHAHGFQGFKALGHTWTTKTGDNASR